MMHRLTRFAAVAALVPLVALLAAPASAQPDVVRMQLDRFAEFLSHEHGLTPSHDYKTATRYEGQLWRITYDLSADQEYVFVAACDEGCTDIDLELYDENGNPVASDTGDDDLPIVGVAPVRSGPFRLDVKMNGCSIEPCKYGVGVFTD